MISTAHPPFGNLDDNCHHHYTVLIEALKSSQETIMQPSIVLTGATGNTGQVIAAELKQRGVSFVAMVHSEARRAQRAALSVPAVVGSFDDPTSLECALEGAEKAYLVCTPD